MTRIIGVRGYVGSTLDLPASNSTVLLAGHSSVKMCNNHPDEAWVNNVEFFRSVLQNSEKLIYASSASVYDGVDSPNEDTNEFNLKSVYDLTKRTIDSLAMLSDKEFYGLRFATVNGWSSNLRIDVMLNKMVYDGRTHGVIHVTNPQLMRPILGIYDLGRAIKAIVEDKQDKRGIYNLASFNASVVDMANYVGEVTGAKVIVKPSDEIPYVFGLDTSKFRRRYSFEFQDTLESIVEDLMRPYERVGERV